MLAGRAKLLGIAIRGTAMKLGLTFGILLAFALLAEPAVALTILNSDAAAHNLKVTAGSETKQVTVAPNQQLENVCSGACLIELENGEQYQLNGGESVSIDGNALFVDSAPGGDAGGNPAAPPQ